MVTYSGLAKKKFSISKTVWQKAHITMGIFSTDSIWKAYAMSRYNVLHNFICNTCDLE